MAILSQQRELVSQSHGHAVQFLKWPIVFWLMFTSFPAGFMPVMAAGAYREMRHDQQVTPKWRSAARIEHGRRTFHMALLFTAGAGIVHLGMVGLAWRKWNGLLLGLRGAGWFVMAWCAFAVGIALGIWIFSTAPV